jgi:hypothetical protein
VIEKWREEADAPLDDEIIPKQLLHAFLRTIDTKPLIVGGDVFDPRKAATEESSEEEEEDEYEDTD